MADPRMPQEVIVWAQARNWGSHHLQWHAERLWDELTARDPNFLAWAASQGWQRASVQEGTNGNGLEFLAMHRVMIRQLIGAFPQHAGLFAGWPSPPLDPRDPQNPLPGNRNEQIPQHYRTAIDRLDQSVGSFSGDDEFGMFIETRRQPLPGNPLRQNPDSSFGLHNYMHGRFSDSNSPVDMGRPEVNIGNQIFWRLHGWIDNRWTAFRAAKGLPENDAVYQAALQAAENHMGGHVHHHLEAVVPLTATPTSNIARPAILDHLFDLDAWAPATN